MINQRQRADIMTLLVMLVRLVCLYSHVWNFFSRSFPAWLKITAAENDLIPM
jgi:hypothetical protein